MSGLSIPVSSGLYIYHNTNFVARVIFPVIFMSERLIQIYLDYALMDLDHIDLDRVFPGK